MKKRIMATMAMMVTITACGSGEEVEHATTTKIAFEQHGKDEITSKETLSGEIIPEETPEETPDD